MGNDRERLQEIKKQIQALNLEAEKILLATAGEPHPEGYGACQYNVCACAGYVHGDTPAVCGRSHCGHYASDHA